MTEDGQIVLIAYDALGQQAWHHVIPTRFHFDRLAPATALEWLMDALDCETGEQRTFRLAGICRWRKAE